MYMIVDILSCGGDVLWSQIEGPGRMRLQGRERCFIVAGRGEGIGDVGQQCHWVCNVVGSSGQDAREVTSRDAWQRGSYNNCRMGGESLGRRVPADNIKLLAWNLKKANSRKCSEHCCSRRV